MFVFVDTLKFIIVHISHISIILSDEWALYNNRAAMFRWSSSVFVGLIKSVLLHPVRGLGSRSLQLQLTCGSISGLCYVVPFQVYAMCIVYHVHTRESLLKLPFSRPAHVYMDITCALYSATHNPPRKSTSIKASEKSRLHDSTWGYFCRVESF